MVANHPRSSRNKEGSIMKAPRNSVSVKIMFSMKRRLTGSANSYDFKLRYRNDETTAPVAILRLLLENFIGKVPGQQKHMSGHLFQKSRWRKDWQTHARHITPLLVGTTIDNEIESFSSDLKIIQKRAPFCCRTIGGHTLVLLFQSRNEISQSRF